MNIYIADTETARLNELAIEVAYARVTSLGIEEKIHPDDSIVECSVYLETEDPVCERFKPTLPISLSAMAVHKITHKDLEDKPLIFEKEYKDFIKPLETANYVIGHNIKYDVDVLALGEDVKQICTLAMARKLLPDLDSHSQSVLLLHILGEEEGIRAIENAHSALQDILNVKIVLVYLLEQAYIDFGIRFSTSDLSELYNFSEFCKIPDKIHFGKHKGLTYLEVYKTDPGYFFWWEYKSDTPPDKYQQYAINQARTSSTTPNI